MPSKDSPIRHPRWRPRLALAFSRHVVRKALSAAIIVGSLSILLNQGDRILAGCLNGRMIIKALITPLIPFV